MTVPNHRQRGRRRSIAALLLVLAACGQAGNSATAPQQKAISMDGKPHILEQRGSFTITSTTLFCVKEPVIDKTLINQSGGMDRMLQQPIDNALEWMGQSRLLIDKSGRVYYGQDLKSYCPDNGHNIIIHQSLSLNAAGTPYRIEMTARQGAALARVGVERKDRSDYPSYWGQFADKITDPPNFQPIFIEEMKMLSPILINAIFN
jgi:hypothetical protein